MLVLLMLGQQYSYNSNEINNIGMLRSRVEKLTGNCIITLDISHIVKTRNISNSKYVHMERICKCLT